MTHRYFLLTCLLGLLSSVPLHTAESRAENEINWQPWSKEIFTQAKAENKLVLLDLVAEWCEFCKKMDATTYKDSNVIRNIQADYIAVRADRNKNKLLEQRYANYGTPATIIFNNEGTELIKRRGYIQPQFMTWMLEAVAADPSPDAHK
jgi:thiol:disulfide interchange protein